MSDLIFQLSPLASHVAIFSGLAWIGWGIALRIRWEARHGR